MNKTLIGVFKDREAVESVIEKLRSKNFDAKDVSIVMRDAREAKELEHNTGADVAGGTVSGITTGALLGGLAGLIAAFVVPGLGAFFIGGPIATALGLTGAAASTVSGAATGAVAGGLVGALTSLGLSDDEAKHYENRVKEGAILVAVPVTETNESFARSVFEENDVADLKTVTQSQGQETMHSRQTTRTHADRDVTEDRGYDDTAPEEAAHYAAGAKGGASSTRSVNPIQLQKYLKDVNYPCSRETLLDAARDHGAGDDIVSTIEQLPDREFSSPTDVSSAIGENE